MKIRKADLYDPNWETNNECELYYMKLVSGEDIISYIRDSEESIELYYPMKLHVESKTHRTGIYHLMKWITSSKEHIFSVKRSHIMFSFPIDEEDMVEFYESGITHSKWHHMPESIIPNEELLKESDALLSNPSPSLQDLYDDVMAQYANGETPSVEEMLAELQRAELEQAEEMELTQQLLSLRDLSNNDIKIH